MNNKKTVLGVGTEDGCIKWHWRAYSSRRFSKNVRILVHMEITSFICLALKYFTNFFIEIIVFDGFYFIGKGYAQIEKFSR
jgi:hypothetical protein